MEKINVVIKEELFEKIISLKKKNFKKEDCIAKSTKYDKNDKYKEYIRLYTEIMNGEIFSE